MNQPTRILGSVVLAMMLACGGAVDVATPLAGHCVDEEETFVNLPNLEGALHQPADDAVRLELQGRQASCAGYDVDIDEFRILLEKKAHARRGGVSEDDFVGQLVLLADANLTAEAAIAWMHAAHEQQYPHVILVGQSSQPRTLAPFVDQAYAAQLQAKLATANPRSQQTFLPSEMTRQVDFCPAASKVLADVPHTQRKSCPQWIAGMQHALPCTLGDNGKIVTLMQMMTRPAAFPQTSFLVVLNPSGRQLDVDSAMTIDQLYAVLREEQGPIWPVASGTE